ncbi:MAG: hypothetical protein ACKVWR_15515 [Acidimicrobiales bacterium]
MALGVAGLFFLLVVAAGIAGRGRDDSAGGPAPTAAPTTAAPVTTGVPTKSANKANSPGEDVTVGGCDHQAVFSVASVRASGTAVNHSSKRSNYMIELAYEMNGVLVKTSTAFVNNVDPGQTAAWDTVFLGEGLAAGGECVVKEVNRYAS